MDVRHSRRAIVSHILENLGRTDSIFGLTEEWTASMLLMLDQLGFEERARAFCREVNAPAPPHKNHARGNTTWRISYSELQALSSRMATYQEVYSRASAIFYARMAHARDKLCNDDDGVFFLGT